jgi:hypothetical protein
MKSCVRSFRSFFPVPYSPIVGYSRGNCRRIHLCGLQRYGIRVVRDEELNGELKDTGGAPGLLSLEANEDR